MAQYDELTGLLRELLTNRFSPKPRYVRGVLGDGLGNVIVPDRPDKSYARFSKNSTTFFEIFNRTVNPVNNWPILIGELPWQPGLTQVVDTDWSAFEQAGWGDILGNTSPHAPTHEWPDGSPGSDAIDIHLRAIVPGRAFVSDGAPTTVYVNSFEYGTTGTLWPGLPGVDLQPVMSATVTGTMRYAGVYVDETTNALGIVTGGTTVYTSALEPPRVSFPETGVIPIARVRVYGGQASIAEADIKDARWLWDSGGGVTFNDSEGDPADVAPTAADGTSGYAARRDHVHEIDITGFDAETTADDADLILIYDDTATAHRKMTRANLFSGSFAFAILNRTTGVKYTSLPTAISAASSGDVIELGDDLSEAAVIVNKAIILRGLTPGITLTITGDNNGLNPTTAGFRIENLRVVNSTTGTTSRAIRCDESGTLDNVIAVCSGGNTRYGVYVAASKTVNLIDCDVSASGGSSTDAGLVVDGTVNVYNGRYAGDDYSLLVGSGTANLYGPRLNGPIFNSGTVRGWYIDGSTGNVIIVGASKLLGSGSNAPDIGSTTAADQFGNIYLASGKDVYADNDEAGLMFRASGLRTVTDRLNSLPALTWATYATYFVTPTVAATLPSQVSAFYNGGTANQTRSFGYLGSYNNYFGAFCLAGIANCRTGIRMDDGSMTNYIELFLEMQSSGLVKLRYRRSDGGTETGPTDLWGGASMPAMRYWLNLARVGNTVYMYAGAEGQYIPVVGAYAFSSWTPTRRGVFHEHPNGGVTDLQFASKWDDLSYT